MSSVIPPGLRLTAGVRAAFSYITGAVHQGLTNTQILTGARAAGFSVNTQNLLDVSNYLRGTVKSAASFQRISPNQVIPLSLHSQSLNILRNQFSYNVLGRGVNPLTGLPQNSNVTVSSQTQLTPAEVLAIAETYYGTPGKDYQMELDTMTIEDAAISQPEDNFA